MAVICTQKWAYSGLEPTDTAVKLSDSLCLSNEETVVGLTSVP